MNAFMITKLAHKQLRLARELTAEENVGMMKAVLRVNHAVLDRALDEALKELEREEKECIV